MMSFAVLIERLPEFPAFPVNASTALFFRYLYE